MSKPHVNQKMTTPERDSRGGRFEIKNGVRVCVDKGTQDHVESNCARSKDGLRIATDGTLLKSPLKSASKSEVTHGA